MYVTEQIKQYITMILQIFPIPSVPPVVATKKICPGE